MKADEFDRRLTPARMSMRTSTGPGPARPNCEAKRVNVDFPAWIVAGLDRHARERGVTRQALIKTWIADRLQA